MVHGRAECNLQFVCAFWFMVYVRSAHRTKPCFSAVQQPASHTVPAGRQPDEAACSAKHHFKSSASSKRKKLPDTSVPLLAVPVSYSRGQLVVFNRALLEHFAWLVDVNDVKFLNLFFFSFWMQFVERVFQHNGLYFEFFSVFISFLNASLCDFRQSSRLPNWVWTVQAANAPLFPWAFSIRLLFYDRFQSTRLMAPKTAPSFSSDSSICRVESEFGEVNSVWTCGGGQIIPLW